MRSLAPRNSHVKNILFFCAVEVSLNRFCSRSEPCRHEQRPNQLLPKTPQAGTEVSLVAVFGTLFAIRLRSQWKASAHTTILKPENAANT